MENLMSFFVDPRIDKPWGSTLREKLLRSVRLRYINWGAKERQHRPLPLTLLPRHQSLPSAAAPSRAPLPLDPRRRRPSDPRRPLRPAAGGGSDWRRAGGGWVRSALRLYSHAHLPYPLRPNRS